MGPVSVSLGTRNAGSGRKPGGAEEDRTPDLLRARQALSQLSYGPFGKGMDSLLSGLTGGSGWI